MCDTNIVGNQLSNTKGTPMQKREMNQIKIENETDKTFCAIHLPTNNGICYTGRCFKYYLWHTWPCIVILFVIFASMATAGVVCLILMSL